MANDYQDMPAVIPDCAPPVEIRAERIRLWRLFDHAADSRCELEIHMSCEPLALQVLRDWSHDRGRAAEPVHHEASERCPAFTVWRCETGLGCISVFSS